MSDPMQEIRASFFIECEELLEALQDGLQAMADGEADSETINIVFRAVHSIKGGAGAFGLDQLVGFAHKFENALDALRDGTLSADDALVGLFFRCADLLSDLVRASREEEPFDDAVTEPVLAELLALGPEEAEAEEDVDFTPMTLDLDLDGLTGADADMADLALPDLPLPDLPLPDENGSSSSEPAGPPAVGSGMRGFTVRFTPLPDLYASGNEPLFLFRLLAELGSVDSRVEATSTLPALDELGPDAALLTWTLDIETTADRTAIVDVFEFVDGLCELVIEESAEQANAAAEEPYTAPPEEHPAADLDIAEALPPAEPEQEKEPSDTPPKQAVAAPSSANGSQKTSSKSPTVRVDLERIDRLVNLVGELVINQAMLAQSVAEAGLPSNSPVSSGLDEFQHLTRNIQESVMMIRAQPVKSLFQRMGRIVREASAATGKDARLITEGETTEIDKTVIERLSDPLTHMIRNAVDHGLEATSARLASGKSERGQIKLTAAHRSGRVVIEVSDDGGGINRERVQALAEEKGLIPTGQNLSDQEIDNLLFLPGFSTAKEVSNLSGRGVGMDVVKSSISALGGRISITSTPGSGTTFSISLPLTLAVLDGMVVAIENEAMVVPLSAIAETLTLTPEHIRMIGPQSRVVLVRDSVVPMLDLGAELGYRVAKDDYEGAIALLIALEDGRRAALVVDRIDDQRQVVIKGLQESYGDVPGIAAATILGDGQIALILDPADLITASSGAQTAAQLQKTG